jgi:hypothetical protein
LRERIARRSISVVEGEQPGDATRILVLLLDAHDKLDEILSILRDDEEEAEDETDT